MAIEVQGMAPLLQVFDMHKSIAFYCDVLGFEIVRTDGKPAPHFRLGAVEDEWCGTDVKHSVRGASRSAHARSHAGCCPRGYGDLFRVPGCGCGVRASSGAGVAAGGLDA